MTRIGRSPMRDFLTGDLGGLTGGFGGSSRVTLGSSDVAASAVTYVGAEPVPRVPGVPSNPSSTIGSVRQIRFSRARYPSHFGNEYLPPCNGRLPCDEYLLPVGKR